MADIAMCDYKECKLSDTCYRFNANANPYAQSYLYQPKEACAEQDYKLLIKKNRM